LKKCAYISLESNTVKKKCIKLRLGERGGVLADWGIAGVKKR